MAVGALVELAFIRWLVKPIGAADDHHHHRRSRSWSARSRSLVWGEGVRALPYFTGDEVDARSRSAACTSRRRCSGASATCVAHRRRSCGSSSSTPRSAGRCAPARRTATRRRSAACRRGTSSPSPSSCPPGSARWPGASSRRSPTPPYDVGTGLAIKGFTVAILGGLGNSTAAVAAGFVARHPRVVQRLAAADRLQGRDLGRGAARHPLRPAERPVRLARGRPAQGALMTPRYARVALFLAVVVGRAARSRTRPGRPSSSPSSRWRPTTRSSRLGLSLLMGYAGQISLGHAGFFAIGGYASGRPHHRRPLRPPRRAPLVALLARLHVLVAAPRPLRRRGAVASTPGPRFVVARRARRSRSRALIGVPVLRLKGHYLAMATLGFGTIVYSVRARHASGSARRTARRRAAVPDPRRARAWAAGAPARVANYYVAWGLVALALLAPRRTSSSRGSGARCAPSTAPRTRPRPWASTSPATSSRTFVLSAVLAAVGGRLPHPLQRRHRPGRGRRS